MAPAAHAQLGDPVHPGYGLTDDGLNIFFLIPVLIIRRLPARAQYPSPAFFQTDRYLPEGVFVFFKLRKQPGCLNDGAFHLRVQPHFDIITVKPEGNERKDPGQERKKNV